jgi:UDP-glucuronate 4-epimerase
MTRVLVTGAAGFIGSTICDRLLREGDVQTVGVDAFSDYYPRSIKEANLAPALSAGLEFHEMDLSTSALDSLLDGIDVIIHQAGQPGVRPSWGSSFDRYIDSNIGVTQKLLEAVRLPGSTVRRFVYASSSSVYGDAESYPTLETMRPQPMSPYGVTKLAAEHLAVLYARNFGVETVSLRYFTVYGPRQRPDMAFTKFIYKALVGDQITIYGDGSQIRDFTYVDDIVDANVRAATRQVPAGSVLNISGGSSHALSEALQAISQAAGKPLDIQYADVATGDVKRTGGESSSARRMLDWLPSVGMVEGIERQTAWMRDNLALYDGVIQ